MAKINRKKKPLEIDKEIADLRYYKWQFLRRNPEYIQDCKDWLKKVRGRRGAKDIILSYPFRGDINQILNNKLDRHSPPDESAYRDLYKKEWSNLPKSHEHQKYLRSLGEDPPETKRQFTWHEYAKKWDISLPLNPDMKFAPRWVKIVPRHIIREPYSFYCKGTFRNDMGLKNSTRSLIEVNWANSVTYLVHEFRKLITNKHRRLKSTSRLKDDRTSLDKFQYYLDIWDLRIKKVSYLEIAKKLHPAQFEGKEGDPKLSFKGLVASVRESFLICETLVKGGYRMIR